MNINDDLLQAEIYRLNVLHNLLDFLNMVITSEEINKENIANDIINVIERSCLEERFLYHSAIQ